MRKAITKRAVDALKPGEIIVDDSQAGFVVRRLPSGTLSYGYRYTKDGKRHWMGLGQDLTPDDARRVAQARAGEVAKDLDPLSERQERRRKNLSRKTLDDVIDGFLRQRVKGLRTESEITSLFDRYVRPKLGPRPIDAIKRLEIAELLDDIAESKSDRTADKVLSVMGTCFRWHATRDDEFRSPIVPGMARLTLKDLSRDRILSDDEIRSVWSALPKASPPAYARLVQALLLSGCRLNEMAGLAWSEVDGDLAIVPAERVKTNAEHVVPITPRLRDVLGNGTTGFVFTTDGGESPFSGFSKAKRRLDAIIDEQRKADGEKPMLPWRLHDLRRTARSLMARAGVTSDIAERVLGHALPGVRGVYDRYSYTAEKRDALTRLAALLDTIVNPPADNVVPMKASR